MNPTRRNIKRASYAPSANREFVYQAVAQQRIDNRNAASTGSNETRRPVLGKNTAVTQELRENAAAIVIQSEVKIKNYIQLLEKLKSDAINNTIRNDGPSEQRTNNFNSLSDNISMLKLMSGFQKERRHAAAMIMPQEIGRLKELESLSGLKSDSDLVVIGHGALGGTFLQGTKEHNVSVDQIALDMIVGGVSPCQLNVRMPACHSADTQLRTSFDVAPMGIQRTESTSSDNSNPPTVATAQSLANAMKVHGFRGTTVTGYQGLGVPHPSGSVEERQIGADETYRAPSSTVAHVFKADSATTKRGHSYDADNPLKKGRYNYDDA